MSESEGSYNRYQIEISRETLAPDWDIFVASITGSLHRQTSLWGQLKAPFGWRILRVVLKDNGRIIAGGQLLVYPLPLLGNIAEMAKGPLVDPDYSDSIDPLITAILQACRENQVQYLVIQPAESAKVYLDHLPQYGFKHDDSDISATIKIDLQPDLDVLLSNMKRQNRQNIRRSERDGMIVREGNKADLHTLYSLYSATCQRKELPPWPFSYIEQLWQTFSPEEHIYFTLAEFNNEVVSGQISIAFGDTVLLEVLGWSGCQGEHRPNEALLWDIMKWAKNYGYHYFDLGGVNVAIARATLEGQPLPEDQVQAAGRFKYMFGGQAVLYPERFDFIFNPLAMWSYRKLTLFSIPNFVASKRHKLRFLKKINAFKKLID